MRKGVDPAETLGDCQTRKPLRVLGQNLEDIHKFKFTVFNLFKS